MLRLLIAFMISLMSGVSPAMAQAPPAVAAPSTPDAAHPRSQHARLCHGPGVARRH